jgi:hypothetical protein
MPGPGEERMSEVLKLRLRPSERLAINELVGAEPAWTGEAAVTRALLAEAIRARKAGT